MRFRGGLVFKAHRLLHHSTLGLRVIKKKKKKVAGLAIQLAARNQPSVGCEIFLFFINLKPRVK